MNRTHRQSVGQPEMPHVMIQVKGMGFSLHENKEDILIRLFSGKEHEQAHYGFQMKISQFLDYIKELTALLARVGYKVTK